jgi:osmoprotectant transport system ATP-binding protein
MIRLQHLSKNFKKETAVKDISFDVDEGENLILLGTSGCGKTTTLRMINRLTDPSGGSIFVKGQDVLKQSPEELRKGIGYVLQHNGLFPHYTVAENIATVPKLLKWNKEKIRQRTIELLDKLHLPPSAYANVYPSQLSGGQQQRVGLARALAADPPILLMDEPFGALDPVTRTNIRKEFKQLEEFQKKTIVLVTHDVQEAFELGDRICLMDKGQIVQIGTTAELLFKPVNDFVRSFLQEQRFILELQAITIKHIYNALPSTENSFTNSTITATTNLWQALQLLSSSNKTYSVSSGEMGGAKKVTLETLMTAFTKFKSNLL